MGPLVAQGMHRANYGSLHETRDREKPMIAARLGKRGENTTLPLTVT